MECKCIKSDVCVYGRELAKAIGNILEIRFGGRPEGVESFEMLIRKYCEFRKRSNHSTES